MKNILKVTILFCLIISLFIIPSFADSVGGFYIIEPNSYVNLSITYNNGTQYYRIENHATVVNYLCISWNAGYNSPCILGTELDFTFNRASNGFPSTATTPMSQMTLFTYNDGDPVYYARCGYGYSYNVLSNNLGVNYYYRVDDAYNDLMSVIDTPSFSKNENVDEFIANTLISMGVKFDTPAYAISYASDAWNWCTNEENVESAHPFDEWDIDSFVSYCNAQSNNYLNWYNGYKLHEDVTKALGEYIRQNIRSLTGLPAGITSLQGAYLPIYHYGSGFQSGVSSPSAQTFYPAQTITYFNGEYVNETNDISTSQFLYSPADVRRFLGYPATGSVIIPSDPAAGTGTITDDPNNPDQKYIEINFPSLDWLADAINSILDFLRNALTTLADLLTQLLDAILGLFSDAFSSLADFGQGIIDFLQSVFDGLSTLLNGYVPSDLAVIIACFIALNFGIGLITFILKGH